MLGMGYGATASPKRGWAMAPLLPQGWGRAMAPQPPLGWGWAMAPLLPLVGDGQVFDICGWVAREP